MWPKWLEHVRKDNGKLVVEPILTTFVRIVLVSLLHRTFKRLTQSTPLPPLLPGPTCLPIIGYLPFLSIELHRQFTELSTLYGPIYKLWRGKRLCVVISLPSLAKEVLRDHDTVFANHDMSVSSSVASYGGNDIVFSPCSQEWKKLRKIFVKEMLSNKTLENSYGLRREEVKKSVKLIYDVAKAWNSVEFGSLAYFTVANAIMSIICGGSLRVAGEKTMDGAEFREDFLQFLLEMPHHSALPNSKDIVVGGTDTTSTTLEWTMAELLMNPDVMNRVLEELTQVVGLTNMVEEFHLTELTYLNAVIKETLRLHPPLPFLVPRCPSQSTTIGGYNVPKGAKIFLNVWAIHRDQNYWENPLEFRPGRFIINNTSDASKLDLWGNNFNFIPLGSVEEYVQGFP